MATEDNGGQSRTLILLMLLLAVLLMVAGLLLTFGRGLFGEETAVVPTTVAVQPTAEPISGATVDGFQIDAPGSNLTVGKVEGGEFAQLLPLDRELVSSIYTIENSGEADTRAMLRVDVDSSAEPRLLDLQAWDGTGWTYMPAEFEDGALVATDVPLPEAVAVMLANQPTDLRLGVEVLPSRELPSALFPAVNTVSVGTLTLGASGVLSGEPVLIQPGEYDEFLRVTNVGLVVDATSLITLLSNDSLQAAHIAELTGRAFDGGYAGVNLDYQGVDVGQSAEFTTFVTNLSNALHDRDLELMLTLDAPQLQNSSWVTGGHDWSMLGAVVDKLLMQMPLNPTLYNDGGSADQIIRWATQQVDRHKLLLLMSANAIDQIGDVYTEMPRELALSNFGELQLLQGGERINVGETLEIGLSGTASALEWDGDGVTYKYTYEQNGQPHTVWLSNESALAHRLRLTERYHLAGVIVRGLGGVVDGDGYIAALESVRGAEAPPSQAAALVWTVTAKDGTVVASTTSSDQFTFAYQDANTAGDYMVNVDFAFGDNQTELGQYAFEVYDAVAEAEAAAAAAAAEAEAAAAAAAAAEAERLANPTGFLTVESNFRTGPRFESDIIQVLPERAEMRLLGRDTSGAWLKVRPVESDVEGWVYLSLVELDEGVDLFALPTVLQSAP